LANESKQNHLSAKRNLNDTFEVAGVDEEQLMNDSLLNRTMRAEEWSEIENDVNITGPDLQLSDVNVFSQRASFAEKWKRPKYDGLDEEKIVFGLASEVMLDFSH
jgi:hypothetical protein